MKKFFRFILIVAIIGVAVFFVVKNKGSKTEEVAQTTANETEEPSVWDSVSNGISNGIEAVGNGVKSGINKVKGDTSAKESSEEEKGLFDKLSDTVKSGKDAAEKAISTHENTTLTGKLVVKGKGKNITCYVKTGFFEKYRVKTITGSEDSYTKLAGYKGKKIKVSGILNTETKEITATTYKLATE